ncbi:MAG: hypothetical protein R2828_10070 [Saprospiraceae bacterium]
MHDLDRNAYEANGYDYEDEMGYEYEDEMAYEDEYGEEMGYEYEDEYEGEYDDEYDYEMGGAPFSEEEEAEMALELLAVTSDEELDELFGKIWSKAKKGLRKVSGSAFSLAKKGLKKAAKVGLPIAGKMVGSYFGGPLGRKLGGKLGSYASSFFEMELEGLSAEDQEFEIAKRFVRFGGNAMRNAARNSGRMPANKAVSLGFAKAARKYAPGLLRRRRPIGVPPKKYRTISTSNGSASGRWIRKGGKIILFGL